MFEIRCIVADKRLGEALRVLKPYALEPPVSIPVDEGGPQVEGSRGVTINANNGFSQEVVNHVNGLAKSGVKTMTIRQLREHLSLKGFRAQNYSYAVTKLVSDGKLKPTKIRGLYEVIRNG